MHANLGTTDVSGKVYDQTAHPPALTGGPPQSFQGCVEKSPSMLAI